MKFNRPASPGGLDLDGLSGALLLITPLRLETAVNTVHGPKDAVVADVVILDGEQAGQVHREAYVWPALLQAALRPGVGSDDPTLGRLAKGEVRKPGQSAPWILTDYTDDDEAIAAKYLSTNGDDSAQF